MNQEELVYQTCILLIKHFKNLIDAEHIGFNSRIFQHMLHWEYDFVGIGHSAEVNLEAEIHPHPEHVVPCAFLIEESRRLIIEGRLSDEEIARLLQKHWKIARITREQARYIDFELGYKSTMPPGWSFENGDTLARLNLANIAIIPRG
jgi:hypothetical protein